MSSLTRRIQRAMWRKPIHDEEGNITRYVGSYFMGRGSRVGVNNPSDTCLMARLLARLLRENRRITNG